MTSIPSAADFIEVYPDALDADTCRAIVARFDASGQDQPGRVGGGLYPELKHSRDIGISGVADWRDVEQRLNLAVLAGLQQYLRTYPFSLIAPLMLQQAEETGTLRRLRHHDIAGMDDAALMKLVMKVFVPGKINLQRYAAGEGGYPYWHCELFPKAADAETLHRHVLWTIYLNDGFEAGETEFFHQQRRIVPRTGSLLIAPTAFTHTHRGNRPLGGAKYIATSWVLFQRAERLYGGG